MTSSIRLVVTVEHYCIQEMFIVIQHNRLSDFEFYSDAEATLSQGKFLSAVLLLNLSQDIKS